MNNTKIPYLTHSWNPIIMRCSPCSPGCAHCWHLKMCDRMAANDYLFSLRYRKTYAGTYSPFLDEGRLREPLHTKAPAMIGTQFMGDLYHSDVRDEDRRRVVGMADDCPQHTFLHLTKRPNRMTHIWNWSMYPIQNIWLGVSISTQKEADENISIMNQCSTPMVKWLSIEPLLEDIGILDLHDISWVVAGCESGPGRRKADTQWVRNIRDQCLDEGVPFFLKQTEINGKVVEMPLLDGIRWDKMP